MKDEICSVVPVKTNFIPDTVVTLNSTLFTSESPMVRELKENEGNLSVEVGRAGLTRGWRRSTEVMQEKMDTR